MIAVLKALPLGFWVAAIIVILGMAVAKRWVRTGTGIPTIVVLLTVTVWYVGDVLYNDYDARHRILFTDQVLADAWWQVVLFLIAFLSLVPVAHRVINTTLLQRRSYIMVLYDGGVSSPDFQKHVTRLFQLCVSSWGVLVAIAALRLRGELIYYFCPYLGHRASPWGRGRIGQGYDALLALAQYFQIFITSSFGTVATLTTNRGVRRLSLMLCLLTWPYYIFARARSIILAVVIPAVLSLAFLRYRRSLIKQLFLIAGAFLVIYVWMAFIIVHRSSGPIAKVFRDKSVLVDDIDETHHLGLNMFEELCWINTFMNRRDYRPNWGARYLAEVVNPIPRTLWPGKPTIGLDYAVLRGQRARRNTGDGGVLATISTGMIGQGVVNFGRLFGPMGAALLMSVWVSLLARMDIQGYRVGRVSLYIFGVILTFNLGRDITLLTLYPFVFGWLLIRWREIRMTTSSGRPA